MRLKDNNGRVAGDNAMIRREIDKGMAEAYELRKEVDFQASKNGDVAGQIRDLDLRLRDKDDQLNAARRDLDAQKYSNSQMRDNNFELLQEKDALEKHAATIQ